MIGCSVSPIEAVVRGHVSPLEALVGGLSLSFSYLREFRGRNSFKGGRL